MQQEDLCLETTLRLDIATPYRTYLPGDYNEEGKGHPLLLFLHGAGERGSDLEIMARIGLPNYIEGGAELPFVTICPQCPNGEVWDVHALIALLDEVVGNYNIDLTRIYATGLSMGGGGVWELANKIADRLAAIIPICGRLSLINPHKLKDLPVWCFHGEKDSVVPVVDSERMAMMLRNVGCDVRLTTYPDTDHDSWTETYNNLEIYDCLLSHQNISS